MLDGDIWGTLLTFLWWTIFVFTGSYSAADRAIASISLWDNFHTLILDHMTLNSPTGQPWSRCAGQQPRRGSSGYLSHSWRERNIIIHCSMRHLLTSWVHKYTKKHLDNRSITLCWDTVECKKHFICSVLSLRNHCFTPFFLSEIKFLP